MGKLASKVAIVTGGVGGIGQSIVRRFVDEGAKVVVLDFKIDGAESTFAGLESAVRIVQGDVSSPESWKTALETAVAHFGKLDIVCNNAGLVNVAQPMHETSLDTLDRFYNVNLKGIFVGGQTVFPFWIEQRTKGVVVKQSAPAQVGLDLDSAFMPSKAAAEGATKALAIEYAQYGIRVVGVAPSITNTDMTVSLADGKSRADAIRALSATLPLGLFAEPEDISNMIAQLASDESRAITGIVIPVDCGRYI